MDKGRDINPRYYPHGGSSKSSWFQVQASIARALWLSGVRRASSSNTAGNLARLALSEGVGSAIVDVGPSSVLARGEEGSSRSGSFIAAERVDAGVLSVVVLCVMLVLDYGRYVLQLQLTAQELRLNKFLLQPVTTCPLQEQTMATEKPLL